MKQNLLKTISLKHFAILFFVLLLTSFSSFAQPVFGWGKNTGGKNWDEGTAMALDSFDNVFMTGNFMFNVDFGSGINLSTNGQNGTKMFVSKADKDGNTLWVKEIGRGGTGLTLWGIEVDSTYIIPTAIDTDSDGNVYITGSFSGSVDFDPGTNVHQLSEPSVYSITEAYRDVFILKLDKDGAFVWAHQYGASNSSELSGSIKIGSDNMVYATGNTANNPFGGSTDFDPGISVNSLPPVSMYVLKLDENGNFVWVKGVTGASASLGDGALAIDPFGDLLIGGGTNISNDIDFDPGVGTSIESPLWVDPNDHSQGIFGATCFVLKLSSDGDFKWVARHDAQFCSVNSITTDALGNVYYTGNLSGYYDIFDADPTSGGTTIFQTNGLVSTFIIKLDRDKNFIFGKQIKGTGWLSVSSIAVNKGNKIYLSGSFSLASGNSPSDPPNAIDFDPGIGVVIPAIDPIWFQNHFKLFLLKLNETGDFEYFGDYGLLDAYGNLYNNTIEIAITKSQCEFFLGGTIGAFGAGGIGAAPDTHWAEPRDYDPGTGVKSITTNGYNDIYLAKFTDNFTPIITPLSSVNFCVGDSVVLDAGSGYASYSWAPTNETTRMITVKNAGDYTITATSVCGTQTSLKATTTVNQLPKPSIKGNNSICIGDTDTLIATGAKTYVWNTTSTEDTLIVSPNVNMQYSIIATDSNGCVNNDTLNVVVNSIPIATAGVDKTICQNDSITLTGSGGASSLWSTGATSNSITVSPTKDSIYIYSAMNGGCIDVDSVNVFVKISPIVTLTPATGFTMTQGSEAILTATGTGTYSWSPSLGLSCDTCASPTVKPTESTEYCVTVTNTDSCQTTKCLKIEIACGELFVPTGFSPNGDNNNDKLEVKINSECVTDYNLLIFDRWGEKVFETTKVTDSWDGKFEGKELDNAVFVYYLKLKLKDNVDPIVKKGNVSIIR